MGSSRLAGTAFLALCALQPATVCAQEWLVLQGVADGEFWASDSGSRLLTRNDGTPGVLGRLQLFAGVAPTSAVQAIALLELQGGSAYRSGDHTELESLILRWTISRALVIEGGKLLTPVGAFSRRRLSPVNPLIGEPDAYPSAYPVGGQISGSLPPFDYRVALVSLPPVHENYVPTPQGTPRLVVGGGISPLIGTRVGWTFTRGTYLSDSVTPTLPAGAAWKDFRHQVFALDGRASRGYLDLHAEWAYAWYDVPWVTGRMSGPAYYVELKYTWTPRLFAAARFQRNDYPFLRPRSGPWIARQSNFYAGEVGLGFRIGRGLLAKVSYQKDDWTDQLDGQAVAAQLSYQFDVTEWFSRKR